MAVTLTTSQQAAADNPATIPALLVDLVVEGSSQQFHFATQPVSWSGIFYATRMTGTFPLTTGVTGGPPYVLSPVKTASMPVANPDGYFSRRRPTYWKGQPLTAKEVFLDVESYAVRTFELKVTGTELVSDDVFQIHAEDPLADVRRKLIPANDCLVTTSLYPDLNIGVFQPGADGNNRPIPWLFGQTYCPMYYVDQDSNGNHIYAACVGSAVQVGSGSVVDWWDGGFSEIALDANAVAVGTQPWSVRYAVRNSTREDGSSFSMPVTEVVVHKSISPGEPIVRRFARLAWSRGAGTAADSYFATPDEVLVWMFRDTFAGAGITPTLIDSDSLLAARSFYLTHSMCFDGALIEQRPFEDWLTQWQHDSMTRLVLRDKIYLAPCRSRTAVYSFCDANLVGTVRYTDTPITQDGGRRTLYYRDRTRDADYGPGDGAQGDDARGGSFVRYDIGSGSEQKASSPFIGRPTTARRVTQYWAKYFATGVRRYDLTSTVKAIHLEEGDPVILTNSLTGCNSQPIEVAGIGRRGDGLYDFSVIETDPSTLYAATVGTDPIFGRYYQRLFHAPTSGTLVGFSQPAYTITTSHQLTGTPGTVRAMTVAGLLQAVPTSLTTANASQCTIAANWTGAPIYADQVLFGYHLYVSERL